MDRDLSKASRPPNLSPPGEGTQAQPQARPLRDQPLALFQQVKNHILERIESGQWPPETRIPSENELVQALGVSRMTAHRALRELTAEGFLVRVQGVGTFVARRKPQSALLEIKSISEDIAQRGGRHSSDVLLLAQEKAGPDLALAMNLARGAPVFRSIIVHRDNGLPVQLADRYVNPALAPDYLNQDFRTMTPSQYLFQVAPLTEAEHLVEAVLPDEQTQKLLEMEAGQPCLVVHRRTWSNGLVTTKARLVHPGSRFQLGGRFKPPSPVKPLVA
ncbi:MAG: histidine utilization repressor [Deltaproteobacteria bacterium]|nr:histidine utilization repressor [Deltaproteobacteria bacterium]